MYVTTWKQFTPNPNVLSASVTREKLLVPPSPSQAQSNFPWSETRVDEVGFDYNYLYLDVLNSRVLIMDGQLPNVVLQHRLTQSELLACPPGQLELVLSLLIVQGYTSHAQAPGRSPHSGVTIPTSRFSKTFNVYTRTFKSPEIVINTANARRNITKSDWLDCHNCAYVYCSLVS